MLVGGNGGEGRVRRDEMRRMRAKGRKKRAEACAGKRRSARKRGHRSGRRWTRGGRGLSVLAAADAMMRMLLSSMMSTLMMMVLRRLMGSGGVRIPW